MELERLLELSGVKACMLVEANMQTAQAILGDILPEVAVQDKCLEVSLMVDHALEKNTVYQDHKNFHLNDEPHT